MADCQLFGLKPGAQHIINVVIHAANAALLFVLLLRWMNALWPAAFAAALFAWHPLRVESVAWISERKDVLSTFFALLALWAYTCYARRRSEVTGVKPNGSLGPSRQSVEFSYVAALICFALGLLSKPMLVTLPFVFLLLDYWPFNRMSGTVGRMSDGGPDGSSDVSPSGRLGHLVLEKWPFFVLSLASCLVTYVVQHTGGMVLSLEQVPLVARLENVPLAYMDYLFKLIWPAHLAVLYLWPKHIALAAVAGCVSVLLFITTAVWLGRDRWPYGLVGWLWFLGTLVPVIGLVPIAGVAMADRYTYLPSIGVFLAVALGSRDLSKRFHIPVVAVGVAASLVLAAGLMLTLNQLRYWRDDVSLFRRVVAVNGDSGFAHLRVGVALQESGRSVESMAEYRIALRLEPTRPETHLDLANLLADSGQTEEALAEYQAALRIDPEYEAAHYNFGLLLARLHRSGEAIAQYARVLREDPDFVAAHLNLVPLLANTGRLDDALKHCLAAARLDPANWRPLFQQARVLLTLDRDAEAVKCLRQALQLDPQNSYILGYLAQVLASDENPGVRDGRAALTLAQQSIVLSDGTQPGPFEVLAMAQAEVGDFDGAQQSAGEVLEAARQYDLTNEVSLLQQQLQLYRRHLPFRQSFTNALAR
jgi:tetratricopeptide (TPR) repeat protein